MARLRKSYIDHILLLPLSVKFVEIEGKSGRIHLLNASKQPMIDENKVPTPNWSGFNLEDYDWAIECLAALEDWIKEKPGFNFRLDVSALRTHSR